MILIVESGATKTDWCLVGPEGPVSRLQTPGMNLSTIASEANTAVFAEAVDAFAGVDKVHFYAAGLLEFPTELDRVFRERFPYASMEYASGIGLTTSMPPGYPSSFDALIASAISFGSSARHGTRIPLFRV